MNKTEITTIINQYSSVDELPAAYKALIDKAWEAQKTTHSPYSHFPVGAALLLEDGTMVMGSNQENASFPLGLCAERIALANYAMHAKGKEVKALAVVVDSAVAAPCGMCRQALLEQEHLQPGNIRVFMQGKGPEVIEVESIESLLPLPFFSKNLKK